VSPGTGSVINATGDLFPYISGVPSSRGVAMNPPPASVIGEVNRMVSDALAQIPDGERAQLVGIATKDLRTGETHVNLALAAKVGSHVEVLTWFGKSWGTPVAAGVVGAGGRIHF